MASICMAGTWNSESSNSHIVDLIVFGHYHMYYVLYVLVIEKTESREHCETERSCPGKQQTLLCVWIHERKPVPADQGQVTWFIGFLNIQLQVQSCIDTCPSI